ncbi:MAG: hypothetical protein ACRCTQ_02985, partial [Brevinemataceae bacterium]
MGNNYYNDESYKYRSTGNGCQTNTSTKVNTCIPSCNCGCNPCNCECVTNICPAGPPGPPGATPYIGPNGNWFISGMDTGYPSRGPKGEPGATPIIGMNGNWFING